MTEIQHDHMLRIFEWNISCGGFEAYGHQTPPPPRLQAIVKGVKQANADVVVLIDTFLWDELYKPDELCSLFGFSSAHSINLNDERLKLNGSDNGITILTNLADPVFRRINLGDRDALQMTTAIYEKEIDVIGTYLTFLDEETRLKEVEVLLGHLSHEKKTILAGDFNSIAPKDHSISEQVLELFLSSIPKTIKGELYEIEEKIENKKVIDFLLSHGLTDAGDRFSPTLPTKVFNPLIPPILRLDYCFVSPDIAVRSCKALYGELYDYASDHYPLLTEVVL